MTDTVQNGTGTATQDLGGNQGQPTERLLTESEANKIIHERTRDVASRSEQKGYQRALDEFNARQNMQSPNAQVASQAQVGMTEEQARHIYADEQRKQQEAQQKQQNLQFAHQFLSKLEPSEHDSPEDKAMLNELKQALPNIPEIVHLASTTDNVKDVMKDIYNNPSKMSDLRTWMQINPQRAYAEIQKLSNSIRANKEAANIPRAGEPISQVQSSALGIGNGSKMTIRDWKNKYTGRL